MVGVPLPPEAAPAYRAAWREIGEMIFGNYSRNEVLCAGSPGGALCAEPGAGSGEFERPPAHLTRADPHSVRDAAFCRERSAVDPNATI